MCKRRVFFSFDYEKDNWRASQIKDMDMANASSVLTKSDWEKVKSKPDIEIKTWIDKELKMRSCLIVLIGKDTSNKKWIKYTIERAYALNKGIVGIHIYDLKDSNGERSSRGCNPFYSIRIESTNERLSKYIECFDSQYSSSAYVYQDIKNNIEELIERALENRSNY